MYLPKYKTGLAKYLQNQDCQHKLEKYFQNRDDQKLVSLNMLAVYGCCNMNHKLSNLSNTFI